MARTIEQITLSISDRLETNFNLSTSKVAEWKLWVDCVAYVIHTFEVAMDFFRTEVEDVANKLIVGTQNWYVAKCYEFQDGHELITNSKTGLLEYAEIDVEAQIIKTAAVEVKDGILFFKVATMDNNGEFVALEKTSRENFENYMDTIKFAGTRSRVISDDGDQIRYDLTVYYDTAVPEETVKNNVLESLDNFRKTQQFGGIIYRHQMLEAITGSSGVVTARLQNLEKLEKGKTEYEKVGTFSKLYAGYFNFSDECTIELISINQATQ